MDPIYITKTSHFLPNNPISNDEMELYLGEICHKASRAKRIVLHNNRIRNRHYALTRSGEITHTNAELVLESIKLLLEHSFDSSQLELLAVGTSSPDVLMPSHGSLVHSLIPNVGSIPVYTSSGVCCSSMHAFENAWNALQLGKASNAIVTGSELMSPLLRSDIFELECDKLHELNENAIIAFEKDFLRFMLSDGSGAFLLEKTPRKGLNYKIEWIEAISYANKMPTCMYQGCSKKENGTLVSWKSIKPEQWIQESIFSIKQDTRILENIIPLAVQFLKDTFEKRQLTTESIRYMLPHISSMYFYDKLLKEAKENGMDFSEDSVFCCLPETGNIGSASIYAALDILSKQKQINDGDLICLGVPESSQFQYSVALLKAVYI